MTRIQFVFPPRFFQIPFPHAVQGSRVVPVAVVVVDVEITHTRTKAIPLLVQAVNPPYR